MKVARVLIFQIGQSLFVTGKPMSYCHAMRMLICGFLLSAAPLAAREVRSGSPQTAKASNVFASEKAKIDVCTLLTSAEIEGVQGEPVMETKASTQPSGGMLVSACVFPTTPPAKSLPVAVAPPPRRGDV